MADYEFIKLQLDGGVATLTLNRPEKRNAISDAMRTELIHALEAVSADRGTRALVLTGEGKGFCAGGDISGMQRRMDAPSGEVAFNGWSRQQHVHHTVSLLYRMPKPTIAAVNGAAAGLGADTALSCDFIVGCGAGGVPWGYSARGADPEGG
ncbi:enoyl-CoA hydratase/isomerase family protein, partial [Achromobacter spanius]|uniref:enoyl-CoA hydratase/isomerase family protein n=1 Tax=Achromobacter spanius TaxID=217203 RepID=UPI003A8F8C5F